MENARRNFALNLNNLLNGWFEFSGINTSSVMCWLTLSTLMILCNNLRLQNKTTKILQQMGTGGCVHTMNISLDSIALSVLFTFILKSRVRTLKHERLFIGVQRTLFTEQRVNRSGCGCVRGVCTCWINFQASAPNSNSICHNHLPLFSITLKWNWNEMETLAQLVVMERFLKMSNKEEEKNNYTRQIH